MDSEVPGRYPVRQRPFPHEVNKGRSHSVVLLVTACSFERKRILDRASSLEAVVSAWNADESWVVGRYIFLPDHIHFFCSPGEMIEPRLDLWMKKWKAHASRNWPDPLEQPIWQRGHWDRQMRGREHYDERWEYVRQNPVRAGLRRSPDQWPWQGEIRRLSW